MKLGVFTVPLYDMPVEKAFEYLSGLGVQTVEIGAGGSPGDKHLKPLELLADPEKLQGYKELLKKYNLEISAISVHGNPVHPNKEIAENDHSEFVTACEIARELGVDTVVTFSGCPGDCETAKYPNWVTCAWPTDYQKILEYQWNDVLIPYWKQAVKVAESYGVTKVALEMHPGFAVYNPGTLKRLRDAVGEAIGTNFDPSHLFWQGIDPAQAIKSMPGAIYHFHAKDTKIDKANVAINGVLDQTGYGETLKRSWLFRTVGYGQEAGVWKDIISALQDVGYDGAISIEHEDALMSVNEGLEKAISFLKNTIIFEPKPKQWWA